MRPLLALALVAGCSSPPPPEPVVVERVQYVYVPEPSPPRLEPGEPIPKSPLAVDAERRREERAARLPVPPPPVASTLADVSEPAPRAQPIHAPTPAAAVVIVRDLPPSQRKHTKGWYDRAAERCERRGTQWARDRCLREVAKQ